ncbi:DUF445 domain-containing protein [Paraburkholderia sp. J12]|uniref:DUF445 domain-containing protein n=1 Tax=Paraburkholderia sp. J12 TaxID=2805432 RepID=UPI002ABD7026|nr:DUF445 domain-containing protein [Paraburkholderia sp. J12]
MPPSATHPLSDEAELQRAKRRPLLLLAAAACVFVVTACWPPGYGNAFIVGALKACSEAAMVGALADWFAVAALFRRLPVPFISAHTGVIPHNKDRIADELAHFVQDRFLDAESLVALIRRHDPAQRVAGWLSDTRNARRLGDYAVQFASGLLELADDPRIELLIRDGLRAALSSVDLSKSMGAVLDTLTRDGRHQELLDKLIDQFAALLRVEETRSFVAARIVDGLKGEYPITEKVLPTAWIGESGARVLTSAVERLLLQISEDREHQLRHRFDEVVYGLIARLKTDPAFLAKGEELKASLRDGAAFADYARTLWDELRGWLRCDLEAPDSVLHAKVAAAGGWLGRTLAADPKLRASLNEHLEQAAHAMAPEFAAFLTRHISDTVKNWDAASMSTLIEQKIGKDLQRIRINGTVLGGAIGFGLYLCSQLFEWLRGLLGL